MKSHAGRHVRLMLQEGEIHPAMPSTVVNGARLGDAYGATSWDTGTDIFINTDKPGVGTLGLSGSVFDNKDQLTKTLLHEHDHVDKLNNSGRGDKSFKAYYRQFKDYIEAEGHNAETRDQRETH